MKKFIVKLEEKVYEVEIQDLQSRPVVAVVDGVKFEVWPENGQSLPGGQPSSTRSAPAAPPQISQSAAPLPASAITSNTVRAPIPGVVTTVKVSVGDAVETGQELCTIEAMKMRNAIRSGRSGVIAAVLISAGQSVNHGEILVEFTE